jgi:hypothetical protein
MDQKTLNEIAQVYNALLGIEVKGMDTINMAASITTLKNIIEREAAAQQNANQVTEENK